MSFEHYPYDGCETPWENLYQEPQLIKHIMQVWRDDGLPANIPMLDTETNAHGGEASVDIFGALWLADSFAGFLTAGGKSTHYYHALPYSPAHPACPNSWGTYHMFMVDKDYKIRLNSSHRCTSYAVFCLKKKSLQTDAALRPGPVGTHRDLSHASNHLRQCRHHRVRACRLHRRDL